MKSSITCADALQNRHNSNKGLAFFACTSHC